MCTSIPNKIHALSGGSKTIREANKRDTEHIFDCVHPVCLYILKHIFQHNHNFRYGTNTTATVCVCVSWPKQR